MEWIKQQLSRGHALAYWAWFQVRKGCGLAWHFIYERLHLDEALFFLSFLRGDYSAKQFKPAHVRHNLTMLQRIQPDEGLTSTCEGELLILATPASRFWFSVWNFLLWGSLQKRVEKVVLYTYLTVTLELNNPFTKHVLLRFLDKKIALLERLLEYVKRVNGKVWDQEEIRLHIEVFRRNSLGQAKVIEEMHKAVKRQGVPAVISEAQAALKKGLQPVLVTQGISGSYWMRGLDRRILGLFKPFDEEACAPNNPVGPRLQGALGLRKIRRGCRIGESAHHEVAAYLVDTFFGFGIVPHTYYAEFTHEAFFSARENRFAGGRISKTKLGSFQEFVEGFVPLDHLSKEEVGAIPLDEFQLLVLLDVILGNTDRNVGNILFGDQKIAAIDHGLCFPDSIDELYNWYWASLEQGKEPLLPSIRDLLNAFPFDQLAVKLHKKCFIGLGALDRMRERVVLFTEGVNAGLVPAQMVTLFAPEYLFPLKDLSTTLKSTAAEQVALFRSRVL